MVILTKLTKKEFDEILENFSIGKYKSHKHLDWALSNTVYLIKTTKGKFILKIFENSEPGFINFQIKIMEHLEREKIPLPKLCKIKSGKHLLIYKGSRITIQKFIESKKYKKYDTNLIKNIAKNQAKMNKALLKVKLGWKYTWEIDRQFKLKKFEVKKFRGFDLIKENKQLVKELKMIDKEKLRRSVIHGDFHGVNFLLKNNKLVGVIDWDDVHEDFLAQEIAIFIAHHFVSPNKVDNKKISIYLNEYKKYLNLKREEERAIYFFIKLRWLGCISYHLKQLKKHKDKSERIIKTINFDMANYKNFNKISLKDFLNLF